IELKRREQAALEQKQNVVSIDQQITARRSQLTDTEHTLEQLPTVAAERIRVLRNDLSSIEQRVAEVNGRQAYVIKAPTSGRVSTLQATVGQIADPKHMQLDIDAYGLKMPLQPDMLLKADVILEQRSLMKWLLDPVFSARM